MVSPNPFRDSAGLLRSPNYDEARDLFWSKVSIKGPDECWPWTASPAAHGYGQFGVKGLDFVSGLAHRWAFYFSSGRPPIDEVRHTCDNPPCCNPVHLIEGTRLENEQDKDARDRRPRGIKTFPCKKCGNPREGVGRRGDGRVFAFCIPCTRSYQENYYLNRSARRD